MKFLIKYTVIIVFFAASLFSCEVQLPYPEKNFDSGNSVSLYSIVLSGDTIKARLAWTENLGDDMYEPVPDKAALWRILKFIKPELSEFAADSIYNYKYKTQLIIKDAAVILTNDTGESFLMTYNPHSMNYESTYNAKPGETVTLSATVTKLFPTQSDSIRTLTVSSHVTIPDWSPDFEILDCEKFYRGYDERDELPVEERNCLDSVATFKILIKEPANSPRHTYRIRVRGVGLYFSPSDNHFITQWTSAFYSTDPLIYDASLEYRFGPWQPYTTDIFTNESFINGQYLLTVSSRFYSRYYYPGSMSPFDSPFIGPSYHDRRIEIELEAIGEELANYISTIYRYRLDTDSYFSEPISLPNNISGGVGIVGTVGNRKIIKYRFPGEAPLIPEFE